MAGMKLFGGHPDLKDPQKLRLIIDEAIAQQASILVAFLQQAHAHTPIPAAHPHNPTSRNQLLSAQPKVPPPFLG